MFAIALLPETAPMHKPTFLSRKFVNQCFHLLANATQNVLVLFYNTEVKKTFKKSSALAIDESFCIRPSINATCSDITLVKCNKKDGCIPIIDSYGHNMNCMLCG